MRDVHCLMHETHDICSYKTALKNNMDGSRNPYYRPLTIKKSANLTNNPLTKKYLLKPEHLFFDAIYEKIKRSLNHCKQQNTYM